MRTSKNILFQVKLLYNKHKVALFKQQLGYIGFKKNSEIFVRKKQVRSQGIQLKKKFGQHFLREQWVIDIMLSNVTFAEDSSIFEIGPGDGFLTKDIARKQFERFWIFEIDLEWAGYIKNRFEKVSKTNKEIVVHHTNILDVDFSIFEPYKPWILLSNLPYQVTFPILYKLVQNRHILKEAVVMVQEEVAQKIVKTSGRGYGFNSLYLQHYFEWKLLSKISPGAFYPPPKVFSRLLYFKPRKTLDEIPDEENFWKFIKRVFTCPRRTIKNNLTQFHYNLSEIPANKLKLRAQQMSKYDLLEFWKMLKSANKSISQ